MTNQPERSVEEIVEDKYQHFLLQKGKNDAETIVLRALKYRQDITNLLQAERQRRDEMVEERMKMMLHMIGEHPELTKEQVLEFIRREFTPPNNPN